MFQKACNAMLSTVIPAVITWRQQRGTVDWAIGAGMFVNPDGWFITAGHILDRLYKLSEMVKIKPPRRNRKSTHITHYIFLFGPHTPGNGRITAHVEPQIDLGIGKLDGLKPPSNYVFPRFRVTPEIDQGELLCRAGYPFVNNFQPRWTQDKGFEFSNLFPVPMFVNEALVSRFLHVRQAGEAGDKNVGIWIETSSPGLGGQSGGPLVDVNGCICGIQINTAHYPLGFKGKGSNQVLHVGRAVHSRTVRAVLEKHNIDYREGGTNG